MGDHSKIEWTDASWNPVRARNLATGGVGHFCVHASEGCRNCYAERLQPRFMNPIRFAAQDRDKVEIFLDEKMLTQPLRWKRPRRIFVGSMTDLFADFVTDEQLDRIFAVMALAPRHTYQVLTKRAQRMREYFSHPVREALIGQQVGRIHLERTGEPVSEWSGLPMPHVWLGVSAEDQRRADERVIHLLRTPAAVRWVSAEPLLEELRLWKLSALDYEESPEGAEVYPLRGLYAVPDCDWNGPKLDWVVAGGESGVKARPSHPDWFRSLQRQCEQAKVPFNCKQHGEWVSVSMVAGKGRHFTFPDGATVRRIGKAAAGRLLDGVEHNGFPQCAT
jgi:protein gp37